MAARLSAGTKVTLRDSTDISAAIGLSVTADLSLFSSLPDRARKLLHANAVERRFAVDEVLFVAGSRPSGIFLVMEGKVRVVRSRHGRQYVVHSEGPGGTLAEISFFEGGVVPNTAIASVATRCLILSRAAIVTAMREDPAVGMLFLKRLAMRLRLLLERLDRVSTQPIPARLAGFLLDRGAIADAGSFTLGMTQEQLAEELGTVRELVVRGLAQLRRAKLIASSGRGRYEIRDRVGLVRLAAS